MASEGLDIELTRNASQTSTNLWSLGCDITIEEIDTEIQEIRVNDISFAGAVITGDFPFTVNYNGDTISLDVCFTLNGLNPNIVESQVVTYEDILLINDLSPEKTSEKRYASSARSVKEIHDIVSNLKSKVDEIEAEQDENTSGLTEEEKAIFDQLKIFLDWFEYDSENNMIRANHGLYSFGPLVAGGTIQGFQPSAANRLEKLNDVQITDVNGGESLVYNEDLGKWINALIEGGEGSAKLEQDISVDIPVGNIKAGITLQGGLSLTEILIMMFSQSISNVPPLVKLSNVPEQCEVGTVVHINPSYKYTDGRYKNTPKGEVAAGCKEQGHIFKLDGVKMEAVPADLPTKDAKQHMVSVEVSYGDSEASVITASGEEYDNKIKAGTVKDEKTFDVCYRWFWGFTDKKINITPEIIWDLDYNGFIAPTASVVYLTNGVVATKGGKDIIIAIPEEYNLSKALDGDISSSSLDNFKLQTPLDVEYSGGVKKRYNIYKWKTTSQTDGSIKNIEITKA